MGNDYMENYKALLGAIVVQQVKDYYYSCKRAYANQSNNKEHYIKRLKCKREGIETGWATYLSLDISSVLDSVEKKAKEREEINWKKSH